MDQCFDYIFILFLIYVIAEPNTRLNGVKQELPVSKSEFSSSFEKLKDSITVKLSDINARLDEIEKTIKKSVTKEVNESIMSIKNTIIDAIKEENLKLQNNVRKLEDQLLLEIDQKSNNLDQYIRRNNLEIQGIPTNVTDGKLEGKVIDIFSCFGFKVNGENIKDCHRHDYANPKNTIVRFFNRKFCYQALDKKMDLHKLDSKRLGFNPVKALYFSENLTHSINYWLGNVES